MLIRTITTGDKDASKAVVAETSKLIGNGVYGHSIMAKERHLNVKFCKADAALKYINDPYFMDLTDFDDENYEVSILFVVYSQ